MGRRRRGMMSEEFKEELAKDLGFYDVVKKEGWEGIRSKDAGNMVKRAIQIAQQHLAKQYQSGTQQQTLQPQMQDQRFTQEQQPYMQTSAQAQPYRQTQMQQQRPQPYPQMQPYSQVQSYVQSHSQANASYNAFQPQQTIGSTYTGNPDRSFVPGPKS
jgi:hypothetical protein